MKLSDYYSHYFNNGGICPVCNHLLTMHLGCTNWKCADCIEHTEKDEVFSRRVRGAFKKKEKEIWMYNQLVRRINARKRRKLDKRQEKKYAEIEHS